MIDVGGPHGICGVEDAQAGLLGVGTTLRPRGEPDDDVDAALVQVQGMGMALAPIPDDRDRLPGQGRRIGVIVVVHLRGHCFVPPSWHPQWVAVYRAPRSEAEPCRHRPRLASSMEPEPLAITTAPVRTNSLMP